MTCVVGSLANRFFNTNKFAFNLRVVSTSMVGLLAKWMCEDILDAKMKFCRHSYHGC